MAVCKTVGSAYPGSNPGPATHRTPGQTRSGDRVCRFVGAVGVTVGSAFPGANPGSATTWQTIPDVRVRGQGPAFRCRGRWLFAGARSCAPQMRPEVDLGSFAGWAAPGFQDHEGIRGKMRAGAVSELPGASQTSFL
jgi:hypothetical protein